MLGGAKPFLCNFQRGQLANIRVKLYVICTSGLGEITFKEKVYRLRTNDI